MNWEERLKSPKIRQFDVDKTGKKGLVSTNRDGGYRLYKWDVSTGKLAQIPTCTDVRHFSLLHDGTSFIYLKDAPSLTEEGHFYQYHLDNKTECDLTHDLPIYNSLFSVLSPSGKYAIFTVSFEGKYHTYIKDLRTKDSKLISIDCREDFVWYGVMSYCDKFLALLTRKSTSNTGLKVEIIDIDNKKLLAELSFENSSNILYGSFYPSKNGSILFTGTTDSDGFHKPFIWNISTDDLDFFSEGLLPEANTELLSFSNDGRYILLKQLQKAASKFFVFEKDIRKITKLDSPPGRTMFEKIFGDKIWCIHENSVASPRIITLDVQSGKLDKEKLTLSKPEPNIKRWENIEFVGARGDKVQGWLELPDADPPFPMVIDIHGGPHTVREEIYSSRFWSENGFALFTINYHGSYSFGSEYQNCIHGRPGELELIDLNLAREHFIKKGITKADEFILHGASYGGYLTLLALGKQPEKWRGGLLMRPHIDWELSYNDDTTYSKKLTIEMMGGTPDEIPEKYKEYSTLTYAKNIGVPVMVISSKKDTRTRPKQIMCFVDEMNKHGKDVDLHWLDTGHMFNIDFETEIKINKLLLEKAKSMLS